MGNYYVKCKPNVLTFFRDCEEKNFLIKLHYTYICKKKKNHYLTLTHILTLICTNTFDFQFAFASLYPIFILDSNTAFYRGLFSNSIIRMWWLL